MRSALITGAVLALLAVHACGISLNLDEIRPSRWMEDMQDTIYNRTLQQMVIPGTHDSGAYNLSHLIQPGYMSPLLQKAIEFAEKMHIDIFDIITPWGTTQEHDFFGQFMGGMRYMDVRCGWNGTEWVTFHMEQGHEVARLLNDTKRFLETAPGEVVVLEVSHLDGNPKKEDFDLLITMIEENLGDYLYPRADNFTSTLGEMISKGWRAMVTLNDTRAVKHTPDIWNGGECMYNTYANSDVLDDMMRFNWITVQNYTNSKWPGQLFKTSWTLTTQANSIEEMFIPGKPHSLKELTLPALVYPFLQFNQDVLGNDLRWGNILLLDFFQDSAILNVTLLANAAWNVSSLD